LTIEVNPTSYIRTIFTADPENIKAMLAGQFTDYGKGPVFHDEWSEFLGDSIFTTDGELWSRSRHLIRPMFVRERIVDTEIFEKHIHKLIPMLGGSLNSGGCDVVNVGALFFRFTLDTVTDYLFGHSVDSLDDPKTTFAEAFQYVLHRQSLITRAG
jgi:cytochrome P450